MPDSRIGNAANTVARLRDRIACNQAHSQAFSRFVLDVLDAREDDTVLDIGPGLGMHLIPVAERVRRIVGLDVSPEMAAELRARLSRPNASIVVGDMDDLPTLDLGAPFTLAYAVYSLHYSRDPARAVRNAAALLAGPRSRFVVIAPDVGNNDGWIADLGRLYEVPAEVLEVAQNCRRAVLPAFRDTFRAVHCKTYRDRIRFSTLEALMTYYDASAPHCRPDYREAALRYFGAKLARDGSYEIAKHTLALVGMR